MKTILLLIFITLSVTVQSQVFGTFETGVAIPHFNPLGSFGVIGVTNIGLTIKADIKFLLQRDQPAFFGGSIGYQWKFLEAGAGGYYMLYSLDKYDINKNKWQPDFYVAGHWKILFIQYDFLHTHQIGIGVRVNLSEN